jgi:hypothetical protein
MNMSRNKKTRKAYRPRAVHVPMMAETHERLALTLHMAVETLISRPSSTAYNEMTKKIASLTDAVGNMRNTSDLSGHRDATANALRTAVMVLDSVWKRWERTGAVAVTEIEAISLRNACGVLDNAIKEIPKNVFDACVLQVNQDAFYRQQGV